MHRIVVISMVKNEADVIESFVRHSLSFADEMIVVDHMSSDKTGEILGKLVDEGLPISVRTCYQAGLVHAEVMNSLLADAVNDHGADIVLPMDADEFLVNTETTEPVRDILMRLDPGVLYRLSWRVYEPSNQHEGEESFLLSRPARRGRGEAAAQKLIVGAGLYRAKPFKLIQGAHFAYREGESGEIQQLPWVFAPLVHTAHYHWRSDEQYAAKVAVSWINNVAKYSVNTPTASYLKRCFRDLADGKRIGFDGLPKDSEPIKIRDFVPPQTLRYSEGTRPDVMRNLMAASVTMAETYLESKVLLRKKYVTIVIPMIAGEKSALASVKNALAQTYPLKEVFVIIPEKGDEEHFKSEVEKLTRGDSVRILGCDGEGFGAALKDLTQAASGDYVSLMLPGVELAGDAIMKMVACIESQDFPIAFAITNGKRSFDDTSPYIDLIPPPEASEFMMVLRPRAWNFFLSNGKYPSAGVTGALIRRELMERRGWLLDCLLDGRALPLSMFRSLLRQLDGEPWDRMAIIQVMYAKRDHDGLSADDWIWHQMEWALLLDEDREILGDGQHAAAKKKLRENRRSATGMRPAADAALWQQYDAVIESLG